MVILFNDQEHDRPGEAAHTYNVSTKEVEAKQSLTSSQPGIFSRKSLKKQQKTTKGLEN